MLKLKCDEITELVDEELNESIADLRKEAEKKTRSTGVTDFVGQIIVAEDQLINLEILESYVERLDLFEVSNFCINGQQAIDKCKELLDKAMHEYDELEVDEVIRPTSLMLLDF